MDPRSKETLKEILEKTFDELTEDDKAFLRARRSYLKASQLKEYDSILNPELPKTKEAPEEEAPLYVAKKHQTSEDSEPVKQENGEA